jgi:uncharacterized membrane protein HdeD (DUF308 family)
MVDQSSVGIARHASSWSIGWGLLLVVTGMLAICSPFLAAVAVTALIGWLIVVAGIVHLAIAFHSHGGGSVTWKLLVGLAYVAFGLYVVIHPVIGLASLTLMLASLFLIEGILDFVLFFKMRPLQGSSWMLIDGVITLLLGLLIYVQWPSSSAWAIGTLVGVSMIMSGISRVMLSLAMRKVAGSGTSPMAKAA